MQVVQNDEQNPTTINDPNNTNKLGLFAGVFVLSILCLFPWIIGLSLVIFLGGYLGYEHVVFKFKPYLLNQIKTLQENDNGPKVGKKEKDNLEAFDPLLHNNYQNSHTTSSPSHKSSCSVCSDSNCTRDKLNNIHRQTSPGPKPSQSPPTSTSIFDTDFKIDSRLDVAVAKFCKAVFDTYIKPNWAPYETRKQLKLSLAKLLASFAESVSETFLNDTNHLQIFCKEKVLPLLFHHLSEQRKRKRLIPSEKKKAYWKVRWLSSKLLEIHLPLQDQKCRLWVELCTSILGDGVLWNLILLGRREIPELIEKCIQRKLEAVKTANEPSSSSDILPASPTTYTSIQETLNMTVDSNQFQVTPAMVPFLMDSFLDPVHDVELAASIASRWRPTLSEILNESEKQFLYCLIQYLKGQGACALEYLQAVLDQTPDGKDYCQRVLELKYITGFCRSKIFLENLGFSQIEEAEDVIESTDSFSGNGKKSHSRSSSYGGVGSGIFKIEQRVVDGFAIYPKPGTPTNSIPSLSPPIPGPVEPDSIFRRRQNVLDNFIGKFYSCVTRNGKDIGEVLGDIEPRTRRGVDTRNYEDEFHLDVISEISLRKCDSLKAATSAVIGCITKNQWIGPILRGWELLAHPFIKNKWEDWINEQINWILTLDNFLAFVELVTNAFIESQTSVLSDPKISSSSSSNPNMTSQAEISPDPEPSLERNLESFAYWLLGYFFDPNETLELFKENRDQIILFFVDLLDIFVTELITSTNHHCQKYRFQRKSEE